MPFNNRIVTVTSTVARASDTNAYVADDVWATSASAPTVGGNTFTGAAKISGGSGIIRSASFITSIAGTLQGEIWVFDQAVTAVNDNATFALSDADSLFWICTIPFSMIVQPSNSVAVVTGINEPFTCVGSANLRYLIRVKAPYTTASAETLTTRLRIEQVLS